jgi:hypothetical protein
MSNPEGVLQICDREPIQIVMCVLSDVLTK